MNHKEREAPVTKPHRGESLGLWGYILALGVGWSLVVALSLGWNLYQEEQEALCLGHGLLWLLGTVGIVFSSWQLRQKGRARQRAEEALEKSTKMYRELVENAGAIIMRLNTQGQVTFFNEYAQHFFGYAEAEVVGRPVVGTIVPETDSGGGPQAAIIQEVCDRPESYPHHEQETMNRHGDRAWVGWTIKPMRNEAGELQEILWVGHDLTEHRRTEEAVAKANAELQALVYEYGERNRQISLLNRMAELLQACLTPSEAYPIIARYSYELFAGCAGSLFVPQATEGLLIAAAVWGETVAGEKEFALGDCWALRTGRPYVGGELEAGIECPHLSSHPVDSYLCVPMMAQGETLGMLHLQLDREMAGETGDFGDDSRELPQQLAVMVADHVALALGNLNLRETLKQQAIRDPLTGLFNRRYLTETLERELHRLKRKAGSLGIIMLDLDHFKKVNDTHGHKGGDALLKVLGGFLKPVVRAGDIACRYGGEEFVLILSEAPLEVTLERARTIHQGVKNLKVPHQGRILEEVTVSVGVAVYPDHGVSGNDLLQAADAALYRAKQEGRDRVVCA